MEKKQNKIDETLEMLEKGVVEVYESDKYKKYLDTMAKFHNYSVNNCILINRYVRNFMFPSYKSGFERFYDDFEFHKK